MNDNGQEEPPAGSDASFAELEEEWAQSSARFHELARMTQNPMYAWLALRDRARVHVGMLHDRPMPEEVAVPGWVAAYLLHVADALLSLSGGSDFRSTAGPSSAPAPPPGMNVIDFLSTPEFQAWAAEQPKLSRERAMALVPAALGLTREGWNAFASLEAVTQKAQEAHAYAEMRERGVPSKKALHVIGSAIGVEDSSHMHRRLREGRKLAGLDKEEVVEPER